ncbi:hypothetical protein [Sphingopyxis flava]|uniref:Uncharacterized protein n=1 Tax=Sphingopyxis flava TaxID=1507287 RepID=A0A1T5BSL1_9SPHN|nr:hypothetical protein [Sphingopyxis flava]SKB49830.1 hypothetical protein SAMN06295937_100779 [Sphingopyxis flava]
MSRASENALDKLHELVAETLMAGLKAEQVSPQMIAQAIKFLKDNGVDAPASSKRVSNLEQALMELDPDDFELRAGLQ